jgi:hypothetical protein
MARTFDPSTIGAGLVFEMGDFIYEYQKQGYSLWDYETKYRILFALPNAALWHEALMEGLIFASPHPQ